MTKLYRKPIEVQSRDGLPVAFRWCRQLVPGDQLHYSPGVAILDAVVEGSQAAGVSV